MKLNIIDLYCIYEVYCLYSILVFWVTYVVYIAGKKILDSVVGSKKTLKGIRASSVKRRKNMAHMADKMIEREYELWKASKSYVVGEITIEQLEEIEKSHSEDFNSAMAELAKRSINRKLVGFLREIFFIGRKKI